MSLTPSDSAAKSPAAPAVWLITQTAQAFSSELIRQVLARGDQVIAFRSHTQGPPTPLMRSHVRCHSVRVDLNDAADVARAVAGAIETYGRIDYLVNMAADALIGAIEEVSDEEAQQALSSKLMAPMRVTRAVLGQMRAQRSGRIIQIASVSYTEGQAGYGLYNATKSALMAMSDSLATEVKPFNIAVSLIEPVPFPQDYAFDSLRFTRRMIDDYYDTSGRTRRKPEGPFRVLGSDPVSGVQAVLAAVTSPEPPSRLIMGREAMARAANRLDRLANGVAKWRETALSAEPVS